MHAGDRLGNYEIVAPLGAGAMGDVYRAKDVRLGREVAIKVLTATLVGDDEAMRRFEQEARTLAALNHPNVAVLHGFEEAGGTRFLVMEFVDGEPLDRRLNGRALPAREALHLAAQIADALDAAHRRGIVHRDLKPANVVVGRRGEVKLIDFGISKLAADPTRDATTQLSTAIGALIGTIPYMSPEQVAGAPVDQRTDVWSFGCVLYEMLTGTRPFSGDSPAATAAAILSTEPDFNRLPPDTTTTVRDLIERCLQKDADRRLASLADVGPALRHRRIAAPPRQRHWRTAAALSAVVIAMALLLVARPWDRPGTPAAPARPAVTSIAVLPLANDAPDAASDYFVDGMTDAFINDLAALNLWKVISRTSVMQYRNTSKPLPAIARELGVDSIIEGSVFRAGDRVRISARLIHAGTGQTLWTDTYERDLKDILALQRGVARDLATNLKGHLAADTQRRLPPEAPVNPETHLLYMKGRYLWNERTSSSLEEAIKHFERVIARDAAYAPAYAGLAESYVLLPGAGERAPRDSFPLAIAAARRAIELDPALAGAHAALGYAALFWEWDWPKAEREFRSALDLNPNYANAHFWYAAGLASRGRLDLAVDEARRAVDLDPVSPIITAGLAWMLNFARDYDAVIRHVEPVLELNPRFPVLLLRIGAAYRHKGQHGPAIAHLRRAVEAAGGTAGMQAELALALGEARQPAEARRILSDVAAAAGRSYVPAYSRAQIHLALGDREAALGWLEKAAEEKGWYVPFMAVEPDLDPLRNESRFQRLLVKVRLENVTSPAGPARDRSAAPRGETRPGTR